MTFNDIKEVKGYIRRYVSGMVDAGQCVNQEWATTDILNTFDDITGPDADFYMITARHWVNNEVKAAIGKKQLVLEGFENLQKAYPIMRGEVRELVPVDQMTDSELEGKVMEYMNMAKGCLAHASELRLYLSARTQTA